LGGRANCLAHDDIGIIRTVSESGLGAGGVGGVGSNDCVWLLVGIWSVEDIFGAGGDISGFGSGRRLLLRLYQKATAIP
jgi:hypothetical protein